MWVVSAAGDLRHPDVAVRLELREVERAPTSHEAAAAERGVGVVEAYELPRLTAVEGDGPEGLEGHRVGGHEREDVTAVRSP